MPLNAAEATAQLGHTPPRRHQRKKSDGPDARLRPPFDDEPGRELDRQRARDGVVLWSCGLGLVAGSKALQRADRGDIGHSARYLCFGRFVLLVVYGDS